MQIIYFSYLSFSFSRSFLVAPGFLFGWASGKLRGKNGEW